MIESTNVDYYFEKKNKP